MCGKKKKKKIESLKGRKGVDQEKCVDFKQEVQKEEMIEL
jgi:hypothetical protein